MKRAAVALGLASLCVLGVVHAVAAPAARAVNPGIPIALAPIDCATFAPPVVAYDTTKGQPSADIQSFLNDLALDGFSVGTISGSIPACVDVLIVRGLIGTVDLPSPYSSAEAASLKSWVDAGHGLLVSGDWGTHRTGTDAVFAAFGYSQGGPGAVTDPDDFDAVGGTDWVIYQSDNFASHAILEGVTSAELLRSAWLSLTAATLITSDANSTPASVAVMAAVASGAGCAVLSTDSDWMANAVPQTNAGYFKRDNSLLARQTIGWLASCGQGPTARPGGPYVVNEGSSVVLDGSASSDPTGDPLTFAWDLDNDGAYDDATIVNPVFSAALRDDGVYTVSLRVSDGVYTDTGFASVTVLNVAPSVGLTADTISATVGAPITFTGSFIDPGALDTHVLRWTFGDGPTIYFGLLTRSHTYTSAGSYTTVLTVTDDDGGVGSAALAVTVIGVPGAPTASAGGPYTVNEGSSVGLDGSGSIGATTYAWDLDNDGQHDDASVPNPTFSAASRDDGVYSVSLRVSNGVLTDTASGSVAVLNVAPSVSLAASASNVSVSSPVTFSGSFVDPGVLDTHTMQWNFGDGSPLVYGLLTRSHMFGVSGTFTPALSVTDDDGGPGSASTVVSVFAGAPPTPTITSVFLPLVARNFCTSSPQYADVVLAMDTSGSMAETIGSGGQTKLAAAQAAATGFVNLLTFPGDQAAVVSFDTDAVLNHALSSDRAGLIAALQSLQALGVTRMDLALAVARGELAGPRHTASNAQVIILLTDGMPNGTTEEAVLAQAAAAKAQGLTIYTIGLGGNVSSAFLKQVATAPNYYYFSPSTTELTEIYQLIGGTLGCR